MAVFIREIRNNAGAPARVQNLARASDTAGDLGYFLPRQSKNVNIQIPGCGNAGEFDRNQYIRIDVEGGGRFAVWQALFAWKDRVRVSTDIVWSEDADVIGGVAATGVLEDLALSNERMLVINDFTLWLVPYGIATTIARVATKARDDGYRLCGAPAGRALRSIPRKSAVSFSMPGISSDAFDRHQPGARFLSRDSGQRREFTLDQQGVVHFQPPVLIEGRSIGTIDAAISHALRRTAPWFGAPPFELLAANGGRVFAKERGADRFYFAMVDLPYIHVGADGNELDVPSTYFKLDPEFNQGTSPPEDLLRSVQEGFVEKQAFGGHTAAERFPLFRLLLGYGVMEAMIVRNRRLTWHLIDARTPMIDVAVNLAATLPADVIGRQGIVDRIMASVAGTTPPSWVPALDDVCYWSNTPGKQEYQKTIHYERVLDIGVGHVPHHEQFESVTGGELMPLRVPAALSDYWADPAQPYRLMNGPVRDADGYIDGTVTYYLLVQLKDDATIGAGPQSLAARVDGYGLLFVDEQSFFAQRWRLAHPDDWRGPMGSMAERVHIDRERHRWQPELYWCPFRGGHVGPRSRLAVAAQVALVTGEHPESGEALLYSINYALSTMDRTWRWRRLPAPPRYFDGQSLWNPVVSTLTGDEQVPSGPDRCVYPQTVRLRDDMTICLRGRGRGADGSIEVGCWYQRYLPATNELVPPVEDPRDAVRAASGNQSGRPQGRYSHPWKFLPESVFRLADQFSHFGVYDVVDSRMQFYTVIPSSPAAQAALVAGERGAWVNDPKRVEDSRRIKIRGYSFRFDWARLPWPSLGDPGWGFETLQSLFAGTMALLIGKVWPPFLDLLSAADRDEIPAVPPMPMEDKSPPSLYNPDTRLRIVRRGSRWIALHWDKRDDDLMPFNLPATVELESREGPELERPGAGGRVQVTLQQNHQRVEQPPAARVAYFNWAPPGPSGEARAVAGFVTGRPQGELSNVWRVRIAAFVPGGNGKTVSLLDVVTVDVVTRLPNFTSQFDEWFHEHRWTPGAAQLAELRQYCSPAGALRYGTSIWVEDAVGHVSVPEEVLWLRTPRPMDLVLDREISVPESQANVDTGIDLQPGDDYALDARGTIRPHWLMAENGPKGLPQVSHEPKYPLSYGDDAYPFSLIGRFGTHPWFYVGAGRPRGRFPHTVTPRRLHLRTNDDAPGGGGGQFVCRVRVWRPRPFSDAAFVHQAVPSTMITGRSYPVSVTMRNNGTIGWISGGANPFRLGSQSPQDNSTWGISRRDMFVPVNAGAEFTFAFNVVAPAPGTHRFQWRMLQELVEWFGDPTPEVAVQVTAASFSGAAFVRQSVPSTMITGRSYPASVTLRNNGTIAWTSGGPNPFRLGSQSPQDNGTWGFGRRELPGPVAPGAEVTFAFDVVAPAPGTHRFRWQMLQELVQWFGDPTPEVAVQVTAASFAGAAFVRQSVPSSMIAGRSYPASVTMRNNGTIAWISGGANPFRLGSQSPQDNSTWGFGRRELPGPVAPGAEVTFAFDVVAPAPGTHRFRWQMLQELVQWFGDPTPELAVQVTAPPLPTLSVSVTPNPPRLNVAVQVVVRAVDSQTGAPVAGRVSINNIDVGATNVPFSYTFRTRLIGVKPNFEIVYPAGNVTVTATGYQPAMLDLGFPDTL